MLDSIQQQEEVREKILHKPTSDNPLRSSEIMEEDRGKREGMMCWSYTMGTIGHRDVGISYRVN